MVDKLNSGADADISAESARENAERTSYDKVKLQKGCGIACMASLVGSVVMLMLAGQTINDKTGATPPTTSAPALPTVEVEDPNARARRVAAARERAEQAAAKVEELLSAEGRLDRDDVEAQLLFWNQIVALAPNDAGYFKERARVQAEVDALARFREHPEEGAEVVKIRPHKGGFGAVMIVDLTIRNRSLSDLKDLRISCVNSGPSGTEIGTSTRILYEMVPARSMKTFPNVNMGLINSQTKSARCRVDSADIG